MQVHGGGWIGGNKEDINLFCDLNANNSDAITVVMTHTLLNGTHNQSSIFRILDEITATITKVREELKEQGFNISKLELAMHGSSSGAHIVSLYSFLIKNHPMEIKFITNTVGPMSVSPYDFLICKNESETLSSIEPEDIEEAKKNGTVGFLNGNDEFHYSQFKLLNDMNIFFGKKYDVPIYVKSTFEKDSIGTLVSSKNLEDLVISGVTKDDYISRITIVGLENKIGKTYELFKTLSKELINVDVIVQSFGEYITKDIAFTVKMNDLNKTIEILKENKDKLGFKDILHTENLSKVSIIGVGIANKPGVASDMFEALYENNINMHMITTSEIKISVLVNSLDADLAVRAIHEKFF